MSTKDARESIVWADYSKLTAMIAVVVLHTAAPVVTTPDIIGHPWWWAGNAYDSFARWCVPVFVMVSGALLLSEDKSEAASEFYRKRVTRLLVPCVFWSMFYMAWTYLQCKILNNPLPDLRSVTENLLRGTIYFHMWFLYMMIGLYAVTPFLRMVIWHSTHQQLVGLVVSLFAVSIANSIFDWHEVTKPTLFINLFPPYLAYFVSGYLIRKSTWGPRTITALTVIVIAGISTALATFFLIKAKGISKGLYFYNYLSVTVVPMSIAIMFVLKKSGNLAIADNFAKRAADMVLGIYLIHLFVMDILNLGGLNVWRFNPLFSIPLLATVTIVISAILVWVIRSVPKAQRIA